MSVVKVGSKEAYYLSFNRDEIFKNLIACEGHFRNFNSQKEDSVGFLNCIVKHLADAEGHCDEAVSHSLIAETSAISKLFLELRDAIRDFRKWVQNSPITRDTGIIETRKIRRRFEGFNSSYDVSKCESCGDSEAIMKSAKKVLSELRNHSTIANHDVDMNEFLVMEQEMAEKLIDQLSKKYGVEPPEVIISDQCHEPMYGIYTKGKIGVCKTGVNLHVLVHEFKHHLQSENGSHFDEGEAERFAINLFKTPDNKRLYALHNSSLSDKKMVIRNSKLDKKDVGVVYGGELLGYSTAYALKYLDSLRPTGFWGQPLSFWGDLIGAAGGALGALYWKAPYSLLSALVGGYLATDLVNHILRLAPVAVAVAVPSSAMYMTSGPVGMGPVPQVNQKGYVYDMSRSGSQGVSVKAPVVNGGRYTV